MLINGVEVAVFREGAGEPVLLVHGSSSDHRTWRDQISALSEGREVITYSRRYHRPNERIEPGADYSMTEQVDDLEALIGALDVGPVHLVGHSYGGLLALIVAGRAPSLVKTLVLEEPPAFTLFTHDPPKPLEVLKLLATRPRLGLALVRFGIKTVGPAKKAARAGDFAKADRIFGDGVLGVEARAALSPEREKQAEENSSPQEILGPGFVKLDPKVVGGISVPALVVSGDQSPILWRLIADELARRLPRAERRVIPGTSHIVHEDDPAAYNAMLGEFFAKASQSVSTG